MDFMKSTGIVRKVDELGRIVLPKEMRTLLSINDRDSLEFFVEDDIIMLKKYQPNCIFCGSMDEIRDFKGKNVCIHCVNDIH